MKGYKNLNGQTAPAVFTVQGVPFYETELTAEEEKAVLDGDLHNQYFILYEWEWECHADNDGGVDSFQFGEKEFPLSAENSILQDGRVIGFFFKKRVFLLQGGGMEEISPIDDRWATAEYRRMVAKNMLEALMNEVMEGMA